VDNEFYRIELDGKRQLNGMEIVMKRKVKWRKGKWMSNSRCWGRAVRTTTGEWEKYCKKHYFEHWSSARIVQTRHFGKWMFFHPQFCRSLFSRTPSKDLDSVTGVYRVQRNNIHCNNP
jgi:hypothetical protein